MTEGDVSKDRTEAVALEGIIPVIPTPFRRITEDVDLEALERLVRFASTAGCGAVCLPAYASEFYKLSEDERLSVVRTAVTAAGGGIKVVAQSNHPSARIASEIARRNADIGADVISFAIPRQFGVTEDDLFEYCATICRAVTLPVLIQDHNPGGRTIGGAFCARLQHAHPNFRYVKLEEPMMAAKTADIREETGDRVGVFEGWGGIYLPELVRAGIRGSMPGLSVADLLVKVWRLLMGNDFDAALDLYQVILPHVVFALESQESFLIHEKRLLKARGLLADATVRRTGVTLRPDEIEHGDRLGGRILALLDRLGMPWDPTAR